MGTRADFYVGRSTDAEWLGSIAMDGYPEGTPVDVCKCKTEAAYRVAVENILSSDDSATRPADGWPWPWEDSRTTDYAYAFDGKQVWACPFGHYWFRADGPDPEMEMRGKKMAVFPNMKARQNVTLSKRSGLLILGIK